MGEPAHTVTSKDRFGLVLIETAPGVTEPAIAIDVPGHGPHIIVDIGLRMLEPRELARAQGFPDDYCWPTNAKGEVIKSRATRLIGNSVSPPVAEALVRANVGGAS